MKVKIIYGRTGSGKSEYCFSEIAKLIEKEQKIYMITPEQFSFTAEKKLMDKLKNNATVNAEVITLSRIAYRVMNEIGGISKTYLTKCGKSMLVYSILNQNKKDLKFLGKSEENINLCIQAITEFKKHGIDNQILSEQIEQTNDKYLKTKLKDMNTIYEQFQNYIQDKYIDETDLLTLLAEEIDKTDFAKDAIIYIDEFSGFTYQEYEVIKRLASQAKQINITMNIDDTNNNTNPDTDIYYTNKQTLKKLQRAFGNNLEYKKLENEYRLKTPELKHIKDNLYKTKSTKYEENVENVHLFLAKNPYSEIENVAKQISKLVKEKNLRYKDISIITKNIESYSSLVRSIFKNYDIPVFIDEKRELNQNVIVQYILAILEILSKNFSNEAIFHYLKLGFCDIEKDEIFKLENYCSKWGIKQNKWRNDFIYDIENEQSKEEVTRLNEIRKQVIIPLLKLKSDLQSNRTGMSLSKELYEFLQKQNIEEKISSKIKDLQEKNLIDLANEYKSSYKIILDILDEIVLIFGNEKITFDKYSKLLKTGLNNSGLGKIPGTNDQVIMGDVERSRSHKVEAVFIVGVNDGIFPSVNKDEGFFNDADREYLKEKGIELANGTIDNLYEEKFNIYKTFTTAEKEIFISYVSADGEGKSLRPSILITNIKKMFPKLIEESDVITKKYEIVNEKSTYEQLLEKIAKLSKKEEIEEIWYNIYQYYKNKNEWKEKLEKDLKGLNYTNLPGKIEKENIEKLYGNTLKTSISKLEKYRSCPFSYYLQYGLRLKEKEELRVQTFNTGSFMHETIDEFFEYVHEENLKLAELGEQQITEIVSRIIEEKLKLSKNYVFTATAKYKVLVKRLKRIVSKALKYIIETIIYSDFSIEGTEIEFGNKGKYDAITLELNDGKKVEITGKIDRLDVGVDKGSKDEVETRR